MAVRRKKVAKGQSSKGTELKTKTSKLKTKLKVEYVDIDKLKMWKRNPRRNDEAVDSIVKSIERFGYTNPVLVSRKDNRVIAGHTRLKALKKIGMSTAAVIYLDLEGTDADLYAVFDNKSTENTPWDAPQLQCIFADLTQLGADVTLSGFSAEEIAELNTEKSNGNTQHIMTFEVTESQRNMIKSILSSQKGDTKTEKLLAALKKKK